MARAQREGQVRAFRRHNLCPLSPHVGRRSKFSWVIGVVGSIASKSGTSNQRPKSAIFRHSISIQICWPFFFSQIQDCKCRPRKKHIKLAITQIERHNWHMVTSKGLSRLTKGPRVDGAYWVGGKSRSEKCQHFSWIGCSSACTSIWLLCIRWLHSLTCDRVARAKTIRKQDLKCICWHLFFVLFNLYPKYGSKLCRKLRWQQRISNLQTKQNAKCVLLRLTCHVVSLKVSYGQGCWLFIQCLRITSLPFARLRPSSVSQVLNLAPFRPEPDHDAQPRPVTLQSRPFLASLSKCRRRSSPIEWSIFHVQDNSGHGIPEPIR